MGLTVPIFLWEPDGVQEVINSLCKYRDYTQVVFFSLFLNFDNELRAPVSVIS